LLENLPRRKKTASTQPSRRLRALQQNKNSSNRLGASVERAPGNCLTLSGNNKPDKPPPGCPGAAAQRALGAGAVTGADFACPQATAGNGASCPDCDGGAAWFTESPCVRSRRRTSITPAARDCCAANALLRLAAICWSEQGRQQALRKTQKLNSGRAASQASQKTKRYGARAITKVMSNR
jgi:hypothetical protein